MIAPAARVADPRKTCLICDSSGRVPAAVDAGDGKRVVMFLRCDACDGNGLTRKRAA